MADPAIWQPDPFHHAFDRRSWQHDAQRVAAGTPIEELRRKDIREFLDWVYELAVTNKGTNPGRTSNKAHEHLRAVISWA
jgi:hypothetical protein